MLLRFSRMEQEKSKYEDRFPDGVNKFIVEDIKPATSKNGREFLVADLKHEDGGEIRVWLNVEEGMRWLLKELLKATGCFVRQPDGDWEINTEELIGKEVIGIIENIQDKYIANDGSERSIERSKIRKFRKVENGKTIPF